MLRWVTKSNVFYNFLSISTGDFLYSFRSSNRTVAMIERRIRRGRPCTTGEGRILAIDATLPIQKQGIRPIVATQLCDQIS